MNTRIQRLMTRYCFAALMMLAAIPAAAAEIVLKPLAVPQGAVVRLGDVAEIKAGDSREGQRLAALPLMPAPTSGKKRYLRLREVQDLLAAHGEDMSQLNLRGEATVEIATTAPALSHFRAAWTGQMPTPLEATAEIAQAKPVADDTQLDAVHQQLERLFVEYLSHASGRNAKWQVTFELGKSELASMAKATTELRCIGGGTPWIGRQKFVVIFNDAKGTVRIPVFTEVIGTQAVVVATKPIERGAIVTAGSVELQELENVPVATAKRAPFDSIEVVVGQEAGRSIQEGDIVMSDDVRPQLLVKRGEEIAVVARGGGIQVRTIARARQDGARGELITVESLDAKEPFNAVVVGAREAVVFAGGAAPADDQVAERPFKKLRQQ